MIENTKIGVPGPVRWVNTLHPVSPPLITTKALDRIHEIIGGLWKISYRRLGERNQNSWKGMVVSLCFCFVLSSRVSHPRLRASWFPELHSRHRKKNSNRNPSFTDQRTTTENRGFICNCTPPCPGLRPKEACSCSRGNPVTEQSWPLWEKLEEG